MKAKLFIDCMPADICIDIVDLAILYALGDILLHCSEVSVVVAASQVGLPSPAF